MTDKEKAFFKECLKNNLVDAHILHRAIPKYSVGEYEKLVKKETGVKSEACDEFKWNCIRLVIESMMAGGEYEFTELMSCININRYLMYEYLEGKRRRDARGKSGKRVSKAQFIELRKYNKKMAKLSRSRIKRNKGPIL